MTFQGSFLIRCRLNLEPVGSGAHGVAYYSVQHVQTGHEFRSSDLAETNEWMVAQNSRYLTECLSESATRSADCADEDAQ
jgi:hypothetical protein